MVTSHEPDSEIEPEDYQAEPEDRAQRDERGRLLPGSVINPYGRKGNPDKVRFSEALRQEATANARSLARAAVKSGLQGNVRALTFIRDTTEGVPKQSLVIERADDPLVRWLSGMGTIDSTIEAVNDLPALPPPTTE